MGFCPRGGLATPRRSASGDRSRAIIFMSDSCEIRGESNRSAAPQQAARPAGSLPAPSFCAFFAACEPERCPLIQESGILLARSPQMVKQWLHSTERGEANSPNDTWFADRLVGSLECRLFFFGFIFSTLFGGSYFPSLI